MPLKEKYRKIRKEMVSQYGKKKGEQVFWAWVNKENIDPEMKAYYFLSEELKSISEDVVEGSFATGHPDRYNDILTEGCLKDMVSQLKALPITIDDNHESFKEVPEEQRFRSFNPLAKVTDATLDGVRVHVKTILNKAHKRYAEIKSSIKEGFLHSFSFAFIPVETKSITIDGVKHRIVDKVRLLNGCFTGIPVNTEATFTNVALKSLREFEFDETEVNKIIGGISMTEEEKKPVEEEAPKAEAEEAPAEEAPETQEETKSLKERVDALTKENAELKAKLEEEEAEEAPPAEEPAAEPAEPEVSEEVKALQKENAELKAKLAEPQYKAIVEKQEAKAPEAEVKSKGPLDMIN